MFDNNLKYIENKKDYIINTHKYKDADFRIAYFRKLIGINSNLNIIFSKIDGLLPDNTPMTEREKESLDNFLKIAFVITDFITLEVFLRIIYKNIKEDNMDSIEKMWNGTKGIKEEFSIKSEYEESFCMLKEIRNASHNNFIYNKKSKTLTFRKEKYPFIKGKLLNKEDKELTKWAKGLDFPLLSEIQEDNILFVVDIIDTISKDSRFNKFIEDPLVEAKKT